MCMRQIAMVYSDVTRTTPQNYYMKMRHYDHQRAYSISFLEVQSDFRFCEKLLRLVKTY